ncbi:Peroxisome biogenesis protein 12 [Bienertia sinuspersici]
MSLFFELGTEFDVRLAFAYQTLYLLDATGFYSLGLHALGIHVCRATGQELMDTSSRISRMRSLERERLRGPPWLKKLQGALLSCMYAVLDYSQTGLIAAVFCVQDDGVVVPISRGEDVCTNYLSPTTTASCPKIFGLRVYIFRADMWLRRVFNCHQTEQFVPLCSERRANPSVITVSGFVFCYGCIFKYVSQYKRCPVTLIAAEVDDIRRLFHDM